MKETIKFDDSNINYINNIDNNLMFLRMTNNYINDLLKAKGYIYLNQIYEMLGVEWDPKRENICLLYDTIDKIDFVYTTLDYRLLKSHAILVDITY